MENNRAEQKEALETLVDFNDRLLNNMRIITGELSEGRKEDTDAFLKDIINVVNWEIGVMNGTLSLLNEGKERVNKEQFNSRVLKFGEAVQANDDAKTAEAIKELIPEFEGLGKAAREVIG